MASAKVTADEKGQVTFEAGGESHRLAFTINAMIEAESAFGGRNITQIGLILSGGASAQGIREQFAACLVERDDGPALLDKLAPAIEFAAAASVLPGDGASLTNLRTLFRCGLVDTKPDLTDGAAGLLMNELGLERAGEIITVAFNAAQTKKASKAAKRPSPAS